MSGPQQFSFANVQDGTRAPGALVAADAEDDSPPPRVQPKKAPAPKPTDIVKLAKARLRDVRRELRRMKALEKERAELERLIAAAEGKQVRPAVGAVVGIKRSAG